MLCGYSLSFVDTNVNKTQMEADILAVYYGMSVDHSVKI